MLCFGGDFFDLVVVYYGCGVVDYGFEFVGGGVGMCFLYEM